VLELITVPVLGAGTAGKSVSAGITVRDSFMLLGWRVECAVEWPRKQSAVEDYGVSCTSPVEGIWRRTRRDWMLQDAPGCSRMLQDVLQDGVYAGGA
jgi:hypothetical protein